LIDDTASQTVLRFSLRSLLPVGKIAELVAAGCGDKAAHKSVKLARDFGDGVEGGSSSGEYRDSPLEALRARDARPTITRRSRSVRAIRFEAFGDPSALEVVKVPAPIAHAKTAVVRVVAASINPSDVKNVAGAMRQTKPPRIPGRDFAGVVEVGPSEWIGAEVWGKGGDTGFTHDGTHAEMIAVPVVSLRRKPKNLSFDEVASVGVNYVAAWCGIEAAGLKPRETLLLIGAGGGVGSAATQIARRLGARVIGADKRAPLPNAPIRAIAETLIVGAEDLPAEVRAATGDKGADVVFDLVGGVMFRSALKCLALRGRLVEIAATGRTP
jgi:NADPH:quinone reductase